MHHLSTTADPPRYSDDDVDSACSTPFVSAPSSPGGGNGPPPSGYYFSAPASPMHFSQSSKMSSFEHGPVFLTSDSGSFEFEFSSRFSQSGSGYELASMTSADELFFNGQIRPMRLSSHLEKSQDLELDPDPDSGRGRDPRIRGGACHRKARSLSPLRITEWNGLRSIPQNQQEINEDEEEEMKSSETTPSCSASSSRSSSSSGRNSKKWIFLKDLLHRSKSEGRAKERFWSFIPAKEKKSPPDVIVTPPSSSRGEKKGKGEVKKKKVAGKPANGIGKRRVPAASAHEVHYKTNRAQAEEMKKKTYLPYRQGLLGCLGFSSKGYGAFTGFTKNFNPISSR